MAHPEGWRRLMNALLPWTPRPERKARVAEARAEAGKSADRAAKARQLEADLRRVLAENHFADILTQRITGNRQGG